MILTYHEVLPNPVYLYGVGLEQFREHLHFAEVNAVRVTLDDGETTQYRHAFPALQEHGIRATIFALPGLVDREYKYMTWAQLREMADCGHSVQSHGWRHRFLTECTAQELSQELRDARLEIETRLGKPVTEISIPYGRYNRRVIEECARAGYSKVYTSDPWDREHRSGVRICGRTMVTRSMDAKDLQAILQSSYKMQAVNRLRHGLKQCVRGALGDSLYHRLWCHLSGYDEQETRQASEYKEKRTSHQGNGS
jgi:peptidoglycan/xylan/chitin deacetylase (PgdA/CDA1 family)